LKADSQTWMRFLRKESNLLWALLRRGIRIHGSPWLLLAFGRCFPSYIGHGESVFRRLKWNMINVESARKFDHLIVSLPAKRP